ncbi:MAG: CerR family C-terminal domain-containing protein [Planctomycetes bacterium]|nr:CerR family C-terminal domain-containing protein [Planctomycetota bacterium]
MERAGANLNAVNYYFRDKQGLYEALFEQAHQNVAEEDQDEFARMRVLPPERRMRSFVEHAVRRFTVCKQTPWQARLMFREMTEPTGVLDGMTERFIRPHFTELVGLVRDIAGPQTPDLALRFCAESIIGQCIHFVHGRAIIEKLIPELEHMPMGVELIAEHITEFSLAAIRNLPHQEPTDDKH